MVRKLNNLQLSIFLPGFCLCVLLFLWNYMTCNHLDLLQKKIGSCKIEQLYANFISEFLSIVLAFRCNSCFEKWDIRDAVSASIWYPVCGDLQWNYTGLIFLSLLTQMAFYVPIAYCTVCISHFFCKWDWKVNCLYMI